MSITNQVQDEYVDHTVATIEKKLRYGLKLNYFLPLIFSVLAFIVIIVGVSLNLLRLSGRANKANTFNPVLVRLSATPIVTVTPNPPLPLPKVKSGYKQTVIHDLRCGYSYSNSHATLVEQAWPLMFRALPLSSGEIQLSNFKESVLNSDLICSSGGPSGSVLCKNIRVEDYVNSLGFRGVKVYRTRYYETNGIKKIDQTDVAYVFPLLNENIRGSHTYTAVVLDLNPSVQDRSSLTILNELADTFFTY
jgi:hypothetical protein